MHFYDVTVSYHHRRRRRRRRRHHRYGYLKMINITK